MEDLDLYKYYNITDIAEIKKDLYVRLKRGGENIDGILSNLYVDPTHFIFELLQNAEDAGAKNVLMNLDLDKFTFEHDGDPFNLDDVFKICSINSSTKREDGKKIGRFGIGFKSVFGICAIPKIFSKDFSFKIENYRIPIEIENPYGDLGKRTITILEFSNKNRTKEEINSLIHKSFQVLDEDTVLFLKNINKIELFEDNISIKTISKKQISTKFENEIDLIEVNISINPSEYPLVNYKLFERRSKISKEKFVQIAYRVDNKSLKSELRNTKLVVFFPTQQTTNLCFKINGPFEPLEHRQSVDFENQINQKVLKEALDLYSESIIILRNLGSLGVDFLNQMPIDESLVYTDKYKGVKDPIYSRFYEKTLQIFQENAILKDINGKYVSANESLFLRTLSLKDLLSKEDLLDIYKTRMYWVKRDTLDSSEDDSDDVLSVFLTRSLKIPSVRYRDFLYATNDEFWKTRNEEWLKRFYIYSTKNIGTLIDNDKQLLRTKPIIMTEDSKMKSPLTNKGLPNVYIDSTWFNSKEFIVKKIFSNDSDCRKFFNEINIQPADALEFVQYDIIDLIKKSIEASNVNEWISGFELIVEIINDINIGSLTKDSIIEFLANELIIPTKSTHLGSELVISRPIDCFLPLDNLLQLYDRNIKILFIDFMYYERIKYENDIIDLLKKIKINTNLKVDKKILTPYTDRQRYVNLLNESRDISKINFSGEDYYILEFDYLVETISPIKSVILWELLGNLSPNTYECSLNYRFVSDGQSQSKTIGSDFIRKLNTYQWIYDDKFVKPSELRYSRIKDRYPQSELLRKLDFIPEIEIPQEMVDKYNLVSSYNFEDLRELIEKDQNHRKLAEILQLKDRYIREVIEEIINSTLDGDDLNKLSVINYDDFDSISNSQIFQHLFIKYSISVERFNSISKRKLSFQKYYEFMVNFELDKIRKFIINYEYKRLLECINERTNFCDFISEINDNIFDFDEDTLNSANFNPIDYINGLGYQIDKQLIDFEGIFLANYSSLINTNKISKEKIEDYNLRSLLYFDIADITTFLNQYVFKEQEQSELDNTQYILEYNKEETEEMKFAEESSSLNKKAKKNKRPPKYDEIGFLGEQKVYEYMLENPDKYSSPSWDSENAPIEINPEGKSGLGYDLSYFENDIKKYIEVKSTTSNAGSLEFYLTRNELKRAIRLDQNYSLYIVKCNKNKYKISDRGNILKNLSGVLADYKIGKINYRIDTIKIRVK